MQPATHLQTEPLRCLLVGAQQPCRRQQNLLLGSRVARAHLRTVAGCQSNGNMVSDLEPHHSQACMGCHNMTGNPACHVTLKMPSTTLYIRTARRNRWRSTSVSRSRLARPSAAKPLAPSANASNAERIAECRCRISCDMQVDKSDSKRMLSQHGVPTCHSVHHQSCTGGPYLNRGPGRARLIHGTRLDTVAGQTMQAQPAA